MGIPLSEGVPRSEGVPQSEVVPRPRYLIILKYSSKLVLLSCQRYGPKVSLVLFNTPHLNGKKLKKKKKYHDELDPFW